MAALRACLAWLLAAACLVAVGNAQSTVRPPNFFVILTDDQDLVLNSTHPSFMPNLNKFITTMGMRFDHFFASSPECCPSRVNMFQGRYAHNHNVTSNAFPHGAWEKFQLLGLDREYLPVWLQRLGYSTWFSGKFINHYHPRVGGKPAGWNEFWGLAHPETYNFYNPAFSHNGEKPVVYNNKYVTDMQLQHGRDFIKNATALGQPFYIQLSMIAPHTSKQNKPAIPARRHAQLFADEKAIRFPNWNLDDVTDFPYPVTRQPPFTPRTASLLDFIHRQRLRSLQAVDEAIATLVWQLKTLGQLDNTYFIYTSDNGYHIGHRRQKGGKRLPYEEDTRVPLFIRGPGIPPRSVNNDLTTMVDLAPTILKLAGGQLREDFDGMPLRLFGNSGGQSPQGQPPYEDPTYVRDTLPTEGWNNDKNHKFVYKSVRVCLPNLRSIDSIDALAKRTDSAVAARRRNRMLKQQGDAAAAADDDDDDDDDEYSVLPADGEAGGEAGEGPYDPVMEMGRAWRARVPQVYSDEAKWRRLQPWMFQPCYKYNVWCTGEKEVFNLNRDPYETKNLYVDLLRRAPWFVARLEALTSVYMTCVGADCHNTARTMHKVLFPSNWTGVQMFEDVFSQRYDAVYTGLPRPYFKQCKGWYTTDNEFTWFRGSEAGLVTSGWNKAFKREQRQAVNPRG